MTTKSLAKRSPHALVERQDSEPLRLWNPFAAAVSFVSFTHSYAEVTSDGSHTHVKSTTTRLSDGKVSKETFEGQLPEQAFGDAVQQAQALFFRQAQSLMQPWLSPFVQTRLPGHLED